MIQRLRWKFVAIIMTVVTLLLAAICSFLFVTVRGSLQEDNISVLRRVITQKGESVVMWDPDSGGILSINPFREQEVSLPYFTVAVNHQGQAAVLDSKFYNLNDEEALLQVVQAGLDAQSDIGVLANYKLRYLRKTTTSGWRIAFTDMTQEISTTRNLLRNLLLIGGSALVGFFFISLLLARWATRPAERAWKQQRQFVADASHELKTPLTVVHLQRGYAPGIQRPATGRPPAAVAGKYSGVIGADEGSGGGDAHSSTLRCRRAAGVGAPAGEFQ